MFLDAYAVVSIGTNSEIEIELDKNRRIVNVKTNDKKNLKSLKKLKGKNIDEGSLLIKQIIDDNKLFSKDDELLICFDFIKDDDEMNLNYEYYIEDVLRKNFDDICINGNKSLNLAVYHNLHDEITEEYIMGKTTAELKGLLKKFSGETHYSQDYINIIKNELANRYENFIDEGKEDKVYNNNKNIVNTDNNLSEDIIVDQKPGSDNYISDEKLLESEDERNNIQEDDENSDEYVEKEGLEDSKQSKDIEDTEKYKNPEKSKETEGSENSKDSEEIEKSENTEDIEDIEDIECSEDSEKAEELEELEDIEEPEDLEDSKEPEKPLEL